MEKQITDDKQARVDITGGGGGEGQTPTEMGFDVGQGQLTAAKGC